MEYPFKDLLPLDEVLEREGYYKDWTHLDPKTFYSIVQISEMIKTKGFGTDVRLLISQLAEHFGLSVVEVTDIANGLIARQSIVENRQDAVEVFNTQVIQEMTDKDVISAPELIESRDGEVKLSARLNRDRQQFAKQLDQFAINVKKMGAKGDGVTDDTYAIQSAVNSLGVGGGTIYFPDGTYLIKGTILLPNKLRLVGYGRKRVILTNNDGTNIYNINEPMVASSNYKTATPNEDIYISSIQFRSSGERTAYPVELINTVTTEINDCDFAEVGNSAVSSLHGLGILRKHGYMGSLYLAKVKHSRFSRSVLHLQATDSYVISNEVWGNEREYAIRLHDAGNSFITQNQIVGGEVYGGLYLTANANSLKIVNNYFDGSHVNIDTCWAIYSNSASCIQNIISNNNFWKQKGGGIKFANISGSRITDNVFEECDYYGKGEPDIELGVGHNPVWGVGGNIISNTHFRNLQWNPSKTALVERPTVSPPPIMVINNTGTPTVVDETILSYAQFYAVAQFTGQVLPRGGNYPSKITPVGYENTYRRTTGTATILAGTTAVWVNHDLGYIPKTVHLTLESALANSKGVYITGKTASGFTIKADTNESLTSPVVVAYEIIKEK